MSFTDTAVKTGANLLRGQTLANMGKWVGLTLAAGAMGAVYQIASDETRQSLHAMRLRSQHRRERHDAILIATLGTDLPEAMQYRLMRSRDAFKCTMRLLADPEVPQSHRDQLRAKLKLAQHPSPNA